jgi:cytochrome c oxidase assembly protein subunit 15
MSRNPLIFKLSLFAAALALVVVVLGAWVRLSDAGLGCPDWPGCYGHIGVPDAEHEVAAANQAFPERPVEVHKAWKEMIHRYVASTLGLVICAIAFVSWRARRRGNRVGALPFLLVALVIFQGLLGMWTVTLLVKPIIVLAHLVGGLTTLSLLWWLALRHSGWLQTTPSGVPALRTPAIIALLVLIGQILLGGWTSTNYAALSCPDLPTCQGQWWPEMDFADAFVPWRGLGVDYEGGVLPNESRVAIHVSHRLGAIAAAVMLGLMAWLALSARQYPVRQVGSVLAAVLAIQLALGLGNVLLSLPLPVATAHNGGAAILLLTMLALLHTLYPARMR